MVTNARGQTVIAGTGEPVTRDRINRLLDGVMDIRPVASETARAQLVADLTAAPGGQGPSLTRPLYVHRGDTRALEINDGAGWVKTLPPIANHVIHNGDLIWGDARAATDISFQVSAANLRQSVGGRASWVTPGSLGFRGISSIQVTAGGDSQGTGRFWPIAEVYQGLLSAVLATSPTTTADFGYARLHWLITGWGTPT